MRAAKKIQIFWPFLLLFSYLINLQLVVFAFYPFPFKLLYFSYGDIIKIEDSGWHGIIPILEWFVRDLVGCLTVGKITVGAGSK